MPDDPAAIRARHEESLRDRGWSSIQAREDRGVLLDRVDEQDARIAELENRVTMWKSRLNSEQERLRAIARKERDRIDELEAALRAAEPWIGHGRPAIGTELLLGPIRRQVHDALRALERS